MSEGLTIEAAHKIAEHHHSNSSERERHLEIIEALLLSLVAIVTAWCGYQAARWDGREAYLYGVASRLRVESALWATEGGQLRLLDVVTFNTWIGLRHYGKEETARLYERRFSPEYKRAFDAWLKTDPFNNPAAPAGPVQMPEYRNALLDQSVDLSRQSSDAFADGAHAREIAEVYVQRTIVLATVLFLTALAQRFKIRKVRIMLLAFAALLFTYQLIELTLHPRL
jgi:hypothetical protein